MPRFGLFVQGAYGNPGLNMLKDEFNASYMAGVRMSWNFGSLYTLKNDRRRIDTVSYTHLYSAAPRAELRHPRAGQKERAHGLHDGEVHHPR